jgi:hypothetical protein
MVSAGLANGLARSTVVVILVVLGPAVPATGQAPVPAGSMAAPSPSTERFQWRRIDGPAGFDEQDGGAWFGDAMAADAAGTIVVLDGHRDGRDIPAWYSLDGTA